MWLYTYCTYKSAIPWRRREGRKKADNKKCNQNGEEEYFNSNAEDPCYFIEFSDMFFIFPSYSEEAIGLEIILSYPAWIFLLLYKEGGEHLHTVSKLFSL